jgi:hypothetical protein
VDCNEYRLAGLLRVGEGLVAGATINAAATSEVIKMDRRVSMLFSLLLWEVRPRGCECYAQAMPDSLQLVRPPIRKG